MKCYEVMVDKRRFTYENQRRDTSDGVFHAPQNLEGRSGNLSMHHAPSENFVSRARKAFCFAHSLIVFESEMNFRVGATEKMAN